MLIKNYVEFCFTAISYKSQVKNLKQTRDTAVCETKYCGIIDQSLFYIDLITVHYKQNFENLT